MAPFDSTLHLRRDPYRFVGKTCAKIGSDAFKSRLMLEPTVFLSGVEAARFFYDTTVFKRHGAAPGFLKKTLFGEGGVQGLDDAAHRHRKALFLDLVGPGRTDDLTRQTVAAINALLRKPGRIVLQDAFERILTRSVCDWAGTPLTDGEIPAHSRMLSHLFEHAGAVDHRQLLARWARKRADRWAAGRIADARSGRAATRTGSVVHRIATWRDLEGNLLDEHVAAVELLNVLRPFVAISAFLTFVAVTLATRPLEVSALRLDPARTMWFIQEVRRTAPFFPLLAARARAATQWRKHHIAANGLVALEIWGTNRDHTAWNDPDVFRPERFKDWSGDPFTMVPQGGGDHANNHRCPGEWVTQDLMVAATRILIERIDWRALPDQNLDLNMFKLPALPKDRFIVEVPN
ncbi:cytochrome P450 [Loktanella sp. M215]|uniref:cytochrome P450 n=2 Tax=Loktanella sp. M215 TaxID=2675431 RepID=UPI001F33D33B|nr:cytochrome P450 [Loktanella sp. M215]MCF7701761.1 cytochrome P450 [Loktanella sp. M215]